MVVCGDEVVVAAARNAAAVDDLVATVNVAAMDGVAVAAAVVVWV